jgi:hypothetical protein
VGEHDAARVDVAALRGAARQYESAGSLVDAAVRTHLTELAFDGTVAGRAHAAGGDSLRQAVEDIATDLRRWSQAAMESAALLRRSADRYAEADTSAARRVG